MIVYEVDYIGLLPAAYDVRAAKQLVELTCRQIGESPADRWTCFSGSTRFICVHSCVSGNYLLTGTLIAGSAEGLTSLPIQYRSSNIAPAASVASMPAQLASTRVVPVDQPSGACDGVVPQRRVAPVVNVATARQNHGLLQAKSLSRAGAKNAPERCEL